MSRPSVTASIVSAARLAQLWEIVRPVPLELSEEDPRSLDGAPGGGVPGRGPG